MMAILWAVLLRNLPHRQVGGPKGGRLHNVRTPQGSLLSLNPLLATSDGPSGQGRR